MYHVVGVDLLPHHQQKPLIRRARFWASFCVQSLKFDRHPFITLRKVVQVAKTNSYRKGAAFLVTRQPVSLSPELQILWMRSHLRLHICSRPCSGLTDLETIEQGTSKKPPRSCFRKCCGAGDWYTIDHHSQQPGRPLFLHQRKRTPIQSPAVPEAMMVAAPRGFSAATGLRPAENSVQKSFNQILTLKISAYLYIYNI